ncbi:MAG TPA: hypothetical protein VNP97_03200 [Microbacterium sp.]|nr:hypothetical protein [Microbacterium sp.]
MGMFTPRPEEPTQWAGIPSDPLEPQSDVESLAAPPLSADQFGYGAVESIVIPMAPILDAVREADSTPGEGDDPVAQ